MRSIAAVCRWCAVLVAFAGVPARAEPPAEPVACIADSKALPEALIGACATVIDAPATADAARGAALLVRAGAFDRRGQTADALADLDRAIVLDAANARAFRLRGELRRRFGGNLASALSDFDEAIRLAPDDARAYDGRGNVYNNMRQYDRAITDYNDALRLDPANAQVFSDRGAAYYFKGDFAAAVQDYDSAIRLDPGRAQTFTNRGAAYKKLGRADLALADESEAIRIDPSVPEYFDNRGLSYAGQSDYDKAIADYDAAIRIRPKANFLTNRADSYQFKGDLDRALADYDAALRLDPSFALAYANRGVVWRKKGERVRALADFDAALKLNPRLEAAITNRKSLALEIERVGAQMPLQGAVKAAAVAATSTVAAAAARPSFDCATARRAVEKVICADPRLSQLDHDLNAVYTRAVKAADGRAAATLRQQQRDFVATRNASFGRPDYDVRAAMEKRLADLRATAPAD
ncbi:tetratricopeptide repeat protein [Bradyrhizobium sp. U87765 SZCCT0131]|uniref:tetratricopeptide repeat protein n=1 Tax=unclassified Bradyrhizobium TaxID=2631580 RepID=UPI001BA99AEE|nr:MULTISPECIES: tetratricopeptide repeat protein [unclassified Bradyrhizobium]MBR1220886.1 tetratricopeptide repeat protein [Bradyrhizobium sp. U87765 SZCCT0131]MBR1260294.1 tetratricopeptide repeat protein [Bradyrhizobium sp. U87765 SZCCT0134]MBR1307457.1 tetratricopeptide repeat protein [Bradyrhizobium sp. U87765 SZCCT0110]MBR1321411.1 tetratricopeptide repeat protein [Bradyrhizobium sp. U87765 SZCCT0109]MBR1349724.1 tetratricopeptide repeat protein [Bradyrhizobium sp. U87765 SZCCT0048]